MIRARLLALRARLDGPLTDRWPSAVYAVRPYDPLADVRRWRWQRGYRCRHAVVATADGPVVVSWPAAPGRVRRRDLG